MLVLTRKIGESVLIDGEIRVTAVALGNGRVKLGFEAPRGVNIRREELPVMPERIADMPKQTEPFAVS